MDPLEGDAAKILCSLAAQAASDTWSWFVMACKDLENMSYNSTTSRMSSSSVGSSTLIELQGERPPDSVGQ